MRKVIGMMMFVVHVGLRLPLLMEGIDVSSVQGMSHFQIRGYIHPKLFPQRDNLLND